MPKGDMLAIELGAESEDDGEEMEDSGAEQRIIDAVKDGDTGALRSALTEWCDRYYAESDDAEGD